jgi:heme o synthase
MINYYLLIKPGIILGNLITFAAGFFLASQGRMDIWLFLTTLLGLAFIIASACVFNNYIDRAVDQKMERTKKRALAQGAIKQSSALFFAVLLGIIGNAILLNFANLLTLALADFGFFVYVCIYSFLKTRTSYSTLIGSVSGAIPPIVGYCAVSNQLDAGAMILFLLMIFWQMPHFFAIGIWRRDDYTKAAIPILPVSKGMYRTKIHMILYILILIPTMGLLTLYGYTGELFLIATTAIGIFWLLYSLKGLTAKDDTQWGRQMFRISLAMINAVCLLVIFTN